EHAFPDEFVSPNGLPPFGFPIHIHVTPPSQPNTVYISPAGYVAVQDAPREAGSTNFSFTPVPSVPFSGQAGGFLDGNILAAATVDSDTNSAHHIEGVSYSSIPVASFTDTDSCNPGPGCQPVSDYGVDISWGDGTDSSADTVSFAGSSGTTATYDLTGSHLYA